MRAALALRRGGGGLTLAPGAVALASGTLSAVVHRLHGHAGSSAEPMTAGEFVVNHPAYGLVLLFAVVALLPAGRGGRGDGSTGGR